MVGTEYTSTQEWALVFGILWIVIGLWAWVWDSFVYILRTCVLESVRSFFAKRVHKDSVHIVHKVHKNFLTRERRLLSCLCAFKRGFCTHPFPLQSTTPFPPILILSLFSSPITICSSAFCLHELFFPP